MDPTRFHEFVRSLTQPASRRAVLGVLAGVAGLGFGAVAAAPPPACGEHQKRCGDVCYDVNFQSCASCKGIKTLGPVGAPKSVICGE